MHVKCNKKVDGKGSYVQTDEGVRLLDFSTGIGVVYVGRCNPKVVKAVQEQAGRIMHAQVTSNPIGARTGVSTYTIQYLGALKSFSGVLRGKSFRIMFSFHFLCGVHQIFVSDHLLFSHFYLLFSLYAPCVEQRWGGGGGGGGRCHQTSSIQQTTRSADRPPCSLGLATDTVR